MEDLFTHKVWMGMAILGECVDYGLIELDGLTAHVCGFPTWFKPSVFSDVEPVLAADYMTGLIRCPRNWCKGKFVFVWQPTFEYAKLAPHLNAFNA